MGSGTSLEKSKPASAASSRSGRSRFLLPRETLESIADRCLKPPNVPPDGSEEEAADLDLDAFSAALESALVESFQQTPELREAWTKAKPIALGSWARGELCPKSDLDMLFVGDETAAGMITRFSQEAGIKIRSRVPENLEDWTVGVEPFDVLALLRAKPLTEEAAVAYEAELTRLKPHLKKLRRTYFAALRNERRERTERFDSIANFLEPNLKYGPGGLRDMGQAYQLRTLFPERFESPERAHALHVFDYYRRFFLMSRIRVQLAEGGGDLLSAYEQAGVASWFGFESTRDFMREIQKGLSRVSFYADVDFEHVRVSEKELAKYTSKDIGFSELAAWLERDPSILVQAKARDLGFRLYRAALRKSEGEKAKAHEALRRLLVRAIDPLQSDDVTIALFRSRWIDLAVTDFKKIVGYVQHDQYHRYTVDAHLMQAVREMKRVAQRPTTLGRLAPIAKSLSKDDWKILGWTALYHDVGKGSGGDHSDKSVVIARGDLTKWGVPTEAIEEIIWLVENHLELSMAAFRGNPAHPATWRMLHAKGIEGKRLLRLAIFTAVDIRATNREAYTPWKERLLFELVEYLEMPEAKRLSKLEQALLKLRAKDLLPVLDRLDPFQVSALPTDTLARDLIQAAGTAGQFPDLAAAIFVKVVKVSKTGRVWIRFRTRRDEPGLFVRLTRALQSLGLSVRHASIMSDAEIGVYDWFEVKPPRSLKGLEAKLSKLLEASARKGSVAPGEHAEIFDEIECLAMSDEEWVVSFRGKDVRGALLSAAEAIASEGLSISWAKVHTWGRQIDDVFGVVPSPGLSIADFQENLRRRVGRPLTGGSKG